MTNSLKSATRLQSSSEFCSSGHPDRLADNIAAIVINDIQKKDGPKSHAAIEVFITHDSVIIAGEATTSLELTKQYLAQVVERAYELSGYLPEMRQYWKKEEVMLAKDMKIINKVSPQSIDIALGTTDKGEDTGWNDQGIMFSSSENTNDARIGTPMLVAIMIGEYLQKYSRESILAERADFRIGPDNKCIVTCDVEEDGFTPKCISAITIAVPHHAEADTEKFNSYIKELVLNYLNEQASVIKCTVSPDCKWVINGTGRFVCHGNVADTSMTGRKISVNHPSAGPLWCNKMIGGGSLVKPFHASDLILNVTARFIANVLVRAGLTKYAVVGVACSIGKKEIQSMFIHGDESFEKNVNRKDAITAYFHQNFDWTPIALVTKFGFFSEGFDFGRIVNDNFFGKQNQPWDNDELILKEAQALNLALGALMKE